MPSVAPMVELFGREEELARLRERLEKQAPFLLYGPAGVGKTLLMKTALQQVASPEQYVYCEETSTLIGVVRHICSGLAGRGDAYVLKCLKLGVKASVQQIQAAIQPRSSLALQGIVMESLRRRPRTLLCDQVAFVSQPFYSYLRELNLRAGVPIVAVARTYHMEEIGFLGNLYSDRRARLELANLDPERAARFAEIVAGAPKLEADNREEFLTKVVEFSGGNPSAILKMAEMAREPHYRFGGHIKLNILYVDYCLRYSGGWK